VADDQIDSGKKVEDMDVEDEKVMDRWSRYIGAMGVEVFKSKPRPASS